MKSKWITGKKPERRGEYIVTIEGASLATTLTYYPRESIFPSEFEDLWLDEAGNEYNVIAWMELPDAYRGEHE